jgi:hypothetical protein
MRTIESNAAGYKGYLLASALVRDWLETES